MKDLPDRTDEQEEEGERYWRGEWDLFCEIWRECVCTREALAASTKIMNERRG